MLNKKNKILLAALLSAVCLSGCGNTSDEEKELASFSASVSEFTDYINESGEKINGLDINKKQSVTELLAILDDMDAEFAKFAEIDAPDIYESVETLANGASTNMSMAVSYYHSAYDADEFNADDADVAYQYYTRAMKNVKGIGYVLSGEEIPTGEDITVYEKSNDGHILDKWLSSDEDENEMTSEVLSEAVN